MANSLFMDNLPFANVSENVMLDKNRSLNNYCDINSLLSSNNDILTDIDPDINNLNPNGLKNQCKSYHTSSELIKEACFQNNITMLHTNICSSSKKIKDLMYYIDNMNITFSFIGLSETWASETNKDLLEIPGYMHEQCIRSNKKKGGGTSLYIHNSIQYKRRRDLAFPEKLYETVFVELDKTIFKVNRNIIIGEIYNPPSSKLKCFNTQLEKLLNAIKKENKYAFLMGDYNVNTINELKSGTTSVHDFSNIFSTYYYHKLINLPTRERKQSSTLLDNIYTNIPDCYNTGSSGILRFLTQSDHYPIFTVRKNVLPHEPIQYITKRIHNQQNIALFRKHMKSSNWTMMGLYQKKPISQSFTLFMNTIKQYFHLRNPWITKELKSVQNSFRKNKNKKLLNLQKH